MLAYPGLTFGSIARVFQVIWSIFLMFISHPSPALPWVLWRVSQSQWGVLMKTGVQEKERIWVFSTSWGIFGRCYFSYVVPAAVRQVLSTEPQLLHPMASLNHDSVSHWQLWLSTFLTSGNTTLFLWFWGSASGKLLISGCLLQSLPIGSFKASHTCCRLLFSGLDLPDMWVNFFRAAHMTTYS